MGGRYSTAESRCVVNDSVGPCADATIIVRCLRPESLHANGQSLFVLATQILLVRWRYLTSVRGVAAVRAVTLWLFLLCASQFLIINRSAVLCERQCPFLVCSVTIHVLRNIHNGLRDGCG